VTPIWDRLVGGCFAPLRSPLSDGMRGIRTDVSDGPFRGLDGATFRGSAPARSSYRGVAMRRGWQEPKAMEEAPPSSRMGNSLCDSVLKFIIRIGLCIR
jgi:hypothetical protein